MSPDEFFTRFGIRPRKANDPLRLGRRKRKRTVLTTLLIGAAVFTLYQERARADVGQHALRTYTEVRTRDQRGLWSHDVVFLSTVVFFTSGTSFNRDTTLPGYWLGKLECIGGGSNGTDGSTQQGGGGGAYAANPSMQLPATVSYAVGAASGDTQINSNAVLAKGGTVLTGGQASSCVGTTKFNGGNGVAGTGSDGGGGGGAAGPHGAGGNASARTGGTGDNGTTSAGANGTQFDATHGSGGGGQGGLSFSGNGSQGGLYGGGGGAGANGGGCLANGTGGAGRPGLIVITYTPFYNAPPRRVRNFIEKRQGFLCA